jgi:hypothetical protein
VAGARNVLLRLGAGHLNFYEQPPKDSGRGAIHHLGVRTDNLEALVAHMEAKGFQFRKAITVLEDREPQGVPSGPRDRATDQWKLHCVYGVAAAGLPRQA